MKMVSRRKILSRSRDDLNLDDDFKEVTQAHFQDDTWYSKEKLYKVGQHPLEPLIQKIIKYFSSQDHVEEILRKWDAIDDEIWAKVIVLERNRRVAKVLIKSDWSNWSDWSDFDILLFRPMLVLLS